MEHAGGPVAADFSALGKQIGKGAVRLGAPWRQARRCAAVDVVEDLADEVGVGPGALKRDAMTRSWPPQCGQSVIVDVDRDAIGRRFAVGAAPRSAVRWAARCRWWEVLRDAVGGLPEQGLSLREQAGDERRLLQYRGAVRITSVQV